MFDDNGWRRRRRGSRRCARDDGRGRVERIAIRARRLILAAASGAANLFASGRCFLQRGERGAVDVQAAGLVLAFLQPEPFVLDAPDQGAVVVPARRLDGFFQLLERAVGEFVPGLHVETVLVSPQVIAPCSSAKRRRRRPWSCRHARGVRAPRPSSARRCCAPPRRPRAGPPPPRRRRAGAAAGSYRCRSWRPSVRRGAIRNSPWALPHVGCRRSRIETRSLNVFDDRPCQGTRSTWTLFSRSSTSSGRQSCVPGRAAPPSRPRRRAKAWATYGRAPTRRSMRRGNCRRRRRC